MHAHNTIHVLTRGIVLDAGHILLCKTTDLEHNFYFLPGGHIEHGESATNALLREFIEETGATCTIKRFLGCLEFSFEPIHNNVCHNHEYNFVFEVTAPTLKLALPLTQLEAHLRLEWVPFDQLSTIDFRAEPLKQLIPKWLSLPPTESYASRMELIK